MLASYKREEEVNFKHKFEELIQVSQDKNKIKETIA
jgi:hypothetical protein